MISRDHCCLCGAPRKTTQAPVEAFGNSCEIIIMKEHRPMLPSRPEESPQMLVNISMWRNGGTSPGVTHMCDECIVVGLKAAKRWVDDNLAALSADRA